MTFKNIITKSWTAFNNFFEFLKPFGDLFIRIWVCKVFFTSGLVKIQSWSSTVLLFQYEYHTPLLSPDIAAYLATFIELGMPPLLLLGIGGRVPAFVLFCFNIFAAVSYPFLWTPAGQVGLHDHFYWGLLLMILLLHGTGKISIDYLFKRKNSSNLV